jgi:cyclic pyranopterin phosphate synthase
MGIVDVHGRVMRKLRVSLIDTCNYGCFYCMPGVTPSQELSTSPEWLSPQEYGDICKYLVQLGLREIRFTGGEPTLRLEFRDIIQNVIASCKNVLLKTSEQEEPLKFALTSNGEWLESHLSFLKDVGCTHINVSLDSLDPGKFERITRGGNLKKVLSSIQKAKELGFSVKVNAVMFRNINSDELLEFHNFSVTEQVEVRFLEFMKIGPTWKQNSERFISAQEMIHVFENHVDLSSVPMPVDSTSFNYTTSDGGKIGFIASESQPFCGGCSRLRLSATGMLRACLMKEDGLNVRNIPVEQYESTLKEVVAMKPTGRVHSIEQGMYAIGG